MAEEAPKEVEQPPTATEQLSNVVEKPLEVVKQSPGRRRVICSVATTEIIDIVSQSNGETVVEPPKSDEETVVEPPKSDEETVVDAPNSESPETDHPSAEQQVEVTENSTSAEQLVDNSSAGNNSDEQQLPATPAENQVRVEDNPTKTPVNDSVAEKPVDDTSNDTSNSVEKEVNDTSTKEQLAESSVEAKVDESSNEKVNDSSNDKDTTIVENQVQDAAVVKSESDKAPSKDDQVVSDDKKTAVNTPKSKKDFTTPNSKPKKESQATPVTSPKSKSTLHRALTPDKGPGKNSRKNKKKRGAAKKAQVQELEHDREVKIKEPEVEQDRTQFPQHFYLPKLENQEEDEEIDGKFHQLTNLRRSIIMRDFDQKIRGKVVDAISIRVDEKLLEQITKNPPPPCNDNIAFQATWNDFKSRLRNERVLTALGYYGIPQEQATKQQMAEFREAFKEDKKVEEVRDQILMMYSRAIEEVQILTLLQQHYKQHGALRALEECTERLELYPTRLMHMKEQLDTMQQSEELHTNAEKYPGDEWISVSKIRKAPLLWPAKELNFPGRWEVMLFHIGSGYSYHRALEPWENLILEEQYWGRAWNKESLMKLVK